MKLVDGILNYKSLRNKVYEFNLWIIILIIVNDSIKFDFLRSIVQISQCHILNNKPW